MVSPLLVLLVSTPARAAKDPTQQISELIALGAAAHAVEVCLQMVRRGEMDDPALRETCGAAQLQTLIADHALGVPIEDLEEHAAMWVGTSAASRSRELAARTLYDLAGTDPTQLDALIARYPDTQAARAAMARYWEEARAAGTAAAIRDYISRYPTSPQAEKARIEEAELAYREALKKNKAAAWATLIQTYPEHPRLDEIGNRLVDALLSDGDSAAARQLLNFSRDWPDHTRAAEAFGAGVRGLTRVRFPSGTADVPPIVARASGAAPVVPAKVTSFYVESPYAPEVALVSIKGGRRTAMEVVLGAWADGVLPVVAPAGWCQPAGASMAVVVTERNVEVVVGFKLDAVCP